MEEKERRSKIAEGYLQVRAIVEVVGKPKKYVEDSIQDHLKKMKKNKNLLLISEDVEKTEKKDNFFSTFAEVEFLIKDSKELMYFCFDYMPSSIEVIEPERITMKNRDLADFMNDLQSRLHVLNTGIIQIQDRNKLFVKNTAVLLRNFLVVLLSSKPMDLKEIKTYMGVKEEDIQKVLEVLINEGKIVKQDEKYKAKPK
jgi:hypothetical protein